MRRFRDEDAAIEKVIHYWPLAIVLFTGLAGYLKLSFTVDQLAAKGEQREKNVDEQRERRSSEMEGIRTRLTKLETLHDMSQLRR